MANSTEEMGEILHDLFHLAFWAFTLWLGITVTATVASHIGVTGNWLANIGWFGGLVPLQF